MNGEHWLLVALAGLVAGAVNAVAGGGSMLSFPALVAAGMQPLQANVTNAVGLLSGYFGGSVAYREELKETRGAVRRYAAAAVLGAVCGTCLLLLLPAEVFEAVVPGLIVAGCLLVVVQPRLTEAVSRRRDMNRNKNKSRNKSGDRDEDGAPAALALPCLFGAGAYGAYFGAGLGVILFATLALLQHEVQQANALKALLSLAVNLVAAVLFAFFAPVDWGVAAVLAVTSLVGGVAGGRFARRLSDRNLRLAVLLAGIGGAVWLVTS
ncbi:sulfite exporter TauE/SafE family protein [Streptomyces sp. MAR4 CNX-425]|uniref:sulfite exporter TauE/SafE family protein n=1 Tax=Streptomyces sp. MAR4 CNX-425 TaxID=3406343 RepID=UPI003B4FFDCD